MAGHSHAANIKHRKNAVDAKRGKLFSKLARAIISAARQGGGDPDANPKVRLAIEKARAANMPKDKIEAAVKKGTGEDADGKTFDELVYEGYAPGGVAVMVSCLTDNRNRTAPDIKHIFDKNGGNLGSTGSVSFQFDFRSIFVVGTEGKSEDELMEIVLEAGAEDLEMDGEYATIYASATDFVAVKDALEAAGLTLEQAETSHVPQNTIVVEDEAEAKRILRLIDALEDNDDVQTVSANYDIKDEWME